MAKVNGSRGLNFTGGFDIDEIIQNQQKVIKGFIDMKKAAEQATAASAVSDTNAMKQSMLLLQEALRASRLEFQKLKNELAALGVAFKQGKIDEQNYRTESAKLRLEQQQLAAAAKAAKIAQDTANGSYNAAKARMAELGKIIRNTTDGFFGQSAALKAQIAEYNALNDRLKAFDATMGNHQRKVGQYENALNNAKGVLLGLAASYLTADAIIGGVRRIITTNKEISDSLADVQRTAGLTADEADALAESLKKIDTRTSLKGLLDIAIIGGQLGIAKDQLAGFTRAVDQLAVSLSGELQGGAEGIAKSLGVLDNVFKVSVANGGDVEKSFNQIGSAILGLGQSGLATGDFLADFGERVGGIAKQAGLSLPAVLAYGAVLQENGVSAEVAGTAFKRLISALAVNPGKFFAVAQLGDANLTLEKFTDLINNDTQKALESFFTGLRKGGTTTTGFMGILKDLKLSQSGVSQSIAALAANQESLNTHIEQAAVDFDNATLSAEQFELKNNNLAGSLEKLQNALDNVTADPNSGIGKALKYIADAIRETLEALQDADSKLRNFLNWTPTGIIWRTLSRGKDILTSPGGFNFGAFGNTAAMEADVKKIKQNQQEVAEQQAALTRSRATDIINTSKSEVDAIRKIKNEIKSLADTQNNLKFNETVIKDSKSNTDKDSAFGLPKNLFIDPELLKASKDFGVEIKKQTGLVDELKRQYQQTYGKAFTEAIKEQGKAVKILSKEEIAAAKAAETARQKALKEAETFYSSFSKLQTDSYGGTLSAREKEEYDLNKKYTDLLAREKNSAEDVIKIKEALAVANANLTEKYEAEDKIKADKLALEKSEKKKQEYDAAVKLAASYNDKVLELQKQHDDAVLALGDKATAEQLANLDKILKNGLSKISLNELVDSEEWVNLFSNLDDLTTEEINKLIKTISEKSKELSKSFNPVDIQQVIDNLEKAKQEVLSRNPFTAIALSIKAMNEANADGTAKTSKQIKQDWVNLAKSTEAAFQFVNDAVQSADFLKEAIGEVGTTAITSLLTIATVSVAVSTAIKTAEKASVILAIISAALVVIQAVASVFKSIFAQHDKRIEKSITDHKNQVDELTAAYGQLERAVQSAIGDNLYAQQQLQIENLKKQQAELVKMRDAETSKKKADQGKINDYNQQIQDNANKIIDINKQIAESLIQTNFKDLSANFADALTEAFKTGANAAEAFDKVFNETIANAIKNSLKLKLLEPVIAEFTTALADYAKNNGNSILGFDFDTYKKKIKDAADLFSGALAGAGNFFAPTTPAGGTTITVDVDAKFDTLNDKIADLFKNGTNSAEDFGKAFSEIIQDSIFEGFKAEVFKDGLKSFYDKLKEFQLSGGGLTKDEIAQLKAEYDNFITDAKAKLKDLENVTGISFDPTNPNGGTTITVDVDTNFDNLKDKLKSLFDSGKISAADFGAAFEEIIKNSILDGFKAQIFADGLKVFYEKLKSFQSSNGGLTEAEIKELREEYDSFVDNAKKKLEELEKVTGITFAEVIKDEIGGTKEVIDSQFQSLEDTIVSIFSTSTDSAADFAKSFEDLMKTAILNSFRATALRDQLTSFYEEFKKLSTGSEGLTAEKIAILKAQYDKIIADGKAKLEDIEKITGINFGGESTINSGGLANNIGRSITEDTASELSGLWRAHFLEAKNQSIIFRQIAGIALQSLDYLIKIELNTRRTADNTERLSAIESGINTIASNTKSSNTKLRDAGLQLPVTVITP